MSDLSSEGTRLEPEAIALMERRYGAQPVVVEVLLQTSIAISLRRIADALSTPTATARKGS